MSILMLIVCGSQEDMLKWKLYCLSCFFFLRMGLSVVFFIFLVYYLIYLAYICMSV